MQAEANANKMNNRAVLLATSRERTAKVTQEMIATNILYHWCVCKMESRGENVQFKIREFIQINKTKKEKKPSQCLVVKTFDKSLFVLVENDPSHAVLQVFAQRRAMVMKLAEMKRM